MTFGTPNRRDILIGAAALAACRPTLGWAAEPPALLALDFTQGTPAGATFDRAGPAMADGPNGTLTLAAAHVPRLALDPTTGRAQGLLIEGAATNFARNSMALSSHTWQFKGAATSGLSQDVVSPDGTHSATRLRIRQQKGDLGVVGGGGVGGAGEIWTFSIYLRQVGDETPEWALNLFDYGTYHGHFERVQLTQAWQRISFSLHWDARDISNKVMNIAAGRPEWTADSMHEAFAWGCQLELGRSPTSLIATDTLPVSRPADIVTIDAAALSRPSGTLRIGLPRGGVRAGTILDTEGGGIRLGYTDSGWLEATVGGLTVSGANDATGDTTVELGWSPAGVTLKSGGGTTPAVLRGAAAGKTGPIACGTTARLFARMDGTAPLNAVLGRLVLEPGAGVQKIAAIVTAPSFVPAGYRLAFGDEFDDGDVARINENATGGKPGAPAWRSRYHQDRFTVINQEKQIYMDPTFAGKAGHPLGVQPFSIKNGILTIAAERADPVAVSPHILNFKYTSGCITSELTHWQTYGYFEMRARLPVGKGFWPAFWLLPKAAKWPPEIDIFEGAGTRPGAVHLGVLVGKGQTADKWIEDVINVGDGFHVYGLEWTREQLTWFLDGKPVWRQPNGINEDMYILANLALGSHDPKFIPDPDDTTPFPGRFEIDYIRAYRKA
ncbi:MAG: exsH [Rhodospirillales bacterium]|nr:exsH [Rhodospirillales bacterium]